MNVIPLTLPVTLLLAAVSSVMGNEVVIQPQIESIGTFKNGFAVVRASFTVPGPGKYRWEQVPQAIHATFSVTSEAVLTTQATTRILEEPTDPNQSGSQDGLIGKHVVVTLGDEQSQAATRVSGRVWQPPTPPVKMSINTGDNSHFGLSHIPTPSALQLGDFLILETEKGREYISRQRIVSISAEGPFLPIPRQVEKPVLVFEVASGSGKVTVSYLTLGMTWLPSYHLDITDPTTLSIRQSTVIKNELTDLKGTDVDLISGYPHIQFSHVKSPLDPRISLAAYFQQLSRSDSSSAGTMGQLISLNSLRPTSESPLPANPEKGTTSTDIYYQSIGQRDLARGDSLALDIATAKSSYSRVVEWQVPKLRDPDGRAKTSESARETPDPEDQPWDAIRFTNPFAFPMTTAPASITEAGKFRGQSLSLWVNPRETTTLRITQALTVSATASETEAASNQEAPKIEDTATFGSSNYRRNLIQGVLQLRNFRATDTPLLIRCRFSGKWLDADAKPVLTRLVSSSSLNPESSLTWDTSIKAGADLILHYRYHIWVRM